jgi:hypothetical protein
MGISGTNALFCAVRANCRDNRNERTKRRSQSREQAAPYGAHYILAHLVERGRGLAAFQRRSPAATNRQLPRGTPGEGGIKILARPAPTAPGVRRGELLRMATSRNSKLPFDESKGFRFGIFDEKSRVIGNWKAFGLERLSRRRPVLRPQYLYLHLHVQPEFVRE